MGFISIYTQYYIKTKGNEFRFKVCKFCWDLLCQGNFSINAHQNKDAASQKLENPYISIFSLLKGFGVP